MSGIAPLLRKTETTRFRECRPRKPPWLDRDAIDDDLMLGWASGASLKTRTIRDSSELVAYFNELAVAYAEARGDADRLLKRNLPDECAKASVRI